MLNYRFRCNASENWTDEFEKKKKKGAKNNSKWGWSNVPMCVCDVDDCCFTLASRYISYVHSSGCSPAMLQQVRVLILLKTLLKFKNLLPCTSTRSREMLNPLGRPDGEGARFSYPRHWIFGCIYFSLIKPRVTQQTIEVQRKKKNDQHFVL